MSLRVMSLPMCVRTPLQSEPFGFSSEELPMLWTRESVSSLMRRVMVLLVRQGTCAASWSSSLLELTSWQVCACPPCLSPSSENSRMLILRSIALPREFLLNFDARYSCRDCRQSISCSFASSSVSTFWLISGSSRLILRESVGVWCLLECWLVSSWTGAHFDRPTSESDSLMMGFGFSVLSRLSDIFTTRDPQETSLALRGLQGFGSVSLLSLITLLSAMLWLPVMMLLKAAVGCQRELLVKSEEGEGSMRLPGAPRISCEWATSRDFDLVWTERSLSQVTLLSFVPPFPTSGLQVITDACTLVLLKLAPPWGFLRRTFSMKVQTGRRVRPLQQLILSLMNSSSSCAFGASFFSMFSRRKVKRARTAELSSQHLSTSLSSLKASPLHSLAPKRCSSEQGSMKLQRGSRFTHTRTCPSFVTNQQFRLATTCSNSPRRAVKAAARAVRRQAASGAGRTPSTSSRVPAYLSKSRRSASAGACCCLKSSRRRQSGLERWRKRSKRWREAWWGGARETRGRKALVRESARHLQIRISFSRNTSSCAVERRQLPCWPIFCRL